MLTIRTTLVRLFSFGAALLSMAFLFLVSPAGAVERISAKTLAAWPEGKRVIVLDARAKNTWAQGHIPNSIPFNWQEYTETDAQKIPYRTFPPVKMATALGTLGLSETDAVVIVGDADTSWGGEGWIAWLLTWTGHKGPVYLLDGGTPEWKKKGYPWNKERPEHIPRPYISRENADVMIAVNAITADMDRYTLVDTRSFPEWLRGHIPEAIHISWKNMVDKKSNTPISPAKVKALLKSEGVPLTKPVVYYCTGGVRSAWSWMAHTMAELPPALNLEGGYEEWKRREQ